MRQCICRRATCLPGFEVQSSGRDIGRDEGGHVSDLGSSRNQLTHSPDNTSFIHVDRRRDARNPAEMSNSRGS